MVADPIYSIRLTAGREEALQFPYNFYDHRNMPQCEGGHLV